MISVMKEKNTKPTSREKQVEAFRRFSKKHGLPYNKFNAYQKNCLAKEGGAK